MDGAHSNTHDCHIAFRSAQLPTTFSKDAAKLMCACSNIQLPTDLPTDIKKSRGIFKILVRKSIKYRQKLLTEFNATAQKNIILFPSEIPAEKL
jgi:hypothetical protein